MPANYEQPKDIVKRVRFFDGQFLKDQDFIDDQKYHIDRQRRPNRILRVSGICEGLVVVVEDNQVKVTPGTALDSQGRLIVLSGDPFAVDLKDQTGAMDIFISYGDEESDITQANNERTTSGSANGTMQGAKGATRWWEKPRIEAVKERSALKGETPMWLGRVTISGSGSSRTVALTTLDDREYSGIYLPSSANPFEAPVLRSGGNLNPKLAVLTGDLKIQGSTANTTAAGLSVTDSAHKTLLYVRNDGNVGIGTTSPQGFHVDLPETSRSSTSPGVCIAGGTRGNASIELRNKDTGTPFIDFSKSSTVDYDARIRLTDSGKLAIEGANLGIGANSPSEKLEVSGNIYLTGNLFLGKASGGEGSKLLLTSWTNSHYIRANNWWTEFVSHPNQGWKFISLGGDTNEATATPQERMRVTSSGNVGIGTVNPGAKLHIINTSQDANGNTLILGPTDGSNLRFGYAANYSWIQSHGSKPIAINPVGNNVGIGTYSPGQTLTVVGTQNSGKHSGSGLDSGGNVAIVSNAPQIDFIDTDTNHNDWAIHVNSSRMYFIRQPWNHTDLVLDGAGNVGIGTTSPGTKLDVSGVVRAVTFQSTSPMQHRMYPVDPLIYRDIFAAETAGAIKKLGNPSYDRTTYASTLWYEQKLIRYGGNNENDSNDGNNSNGAEVTIPAGYDTVWIRVLGDRWALVKAFFLDGAREQIGHWTGGWRGLNCYCPDGSLSDGTTLPGDDSFFYHQWVPIPAGRSGRLALISKTIANGGGTVADFWVSGVAFSKNPWGHAVQSAVGYHWAVNGGDRTTWDTDWHKWNNDSLSRINVKTNWQLKVPVVPSGRDKLLYLVEHNANWNGCMHNGITVNGKSIERFISGYDNPFARHWNGKLYARYIAARIPASLISSTSRHLDVRIDMSKQNNGIYFREIGTHDLDTPTQGW